MFGCYDIYPNRKGFWCRLGFHSWSHFESNPTLYRLVSKFVRNEEPTSMTYMVRRCSSCNQFDLD